MKFCSNCQRCYEDEVLSCTVEGHSSLSETRRGSCEMIAGYRLEFLVESGIQGDVFGARRTDCGQACLIRIISADAQHSEHFLSEAKLAASLFHPNMADVYEAGSLESGELYVVAEHTGCETLRDLLDNVGVPQLLTSIQIVRQAAEALHELHLKGLMHRAVRPENIVLSTDPEHRLLVRVQNLDFGGVVERSIVSNKFLIDTAIDSLRYFAPEQFSGETASIKTDVYGLGIVFYEMLAGAPPFDDAKAAGVIEKHKNQRPPDIKIDDFDLRMLVTHAVTEALQKRPEKRQSSANTLARQLRHIEQLATHVSTPPPAGVMPSAPVRSIDISGIVAAPARPTQVFQIQPPAIETPKSVYNNDAIQSVEVRVEPEPEPGKTIETVVAEPRAISAVDVAVDLPEMPVVLFEESAAAHLAQEDIAHSERRSRLKFHRKRTHSKLPEVVISESKQPPAEIELDRIQYVPEVPARAPVKIEWEQPEDDIPSVADVIEVMAREPIDERPIVNARSEPVKIEWEQPEDDIPSVADVVEVLAREPIAEVPVVHTQPEIVRTPVKIEWEQPEDDIPSVADAVEVLAREPIAEMPVVHAQHEKSVAASVSVPKIKPKRRLKRIPAAQAEDEEITQVRPPRRIRVEWEKHSVPATRFSSSIPAEISFFPTILGSIETRKTIDLDRRDAIFAAYSDPSRAGVSVFQGLLMIFGLFMAITALFLLGSDSVGRYVREWSADDRVTAKTTTIEETHPQAVATSDVSASKKMVLKPLEKTLPDTDVSDVVRSRALPEKERVLISDDKPQPSASRNSVESLRPVASTLVITSRNGKIETKTEPTKNSGATRPRIVKDPKP